MTYTVTSAKTEPKTFATMAEAFRFAIEAEAEYQPAGGVDVTDDDGGVTYTAADGRIAVEVVAGDDTEEGAVMLVDGALVIAWQQGTRTPFDPRNVIPA